MDQEIEKLAHSLGLDKDLCKYIIKNVERPEPLLINKYGLASDTKFPPVPPRDENLIKVRKEEDLFILNLAAGISKKNFGLVKNHRRVMRDSYKNLGYMTLDFSVSPEYRDSAVVTAAENMVLALETSAIKCKREYLKQKESENPRPRNPLETIKDPTPHGGRG